MPEFRVSVYGKEYLIVRDTDGKFILPDEVRAMQPLGTSLKPAYEPIIVARKPLAGTVAANCLGHGCGAINVDGCRVGTEENTGRPCGTHGWQATTKGFTQSGELVTESHALGRWPANIIHDGSDEVLAGFPETCKSTGGNSGVKGNKIYGKFAGRPTGEDPGFGDSGSAARFFYCAKASRSDRGEGNTHPTVKPLKLMEYLVKLVAMPGENRILDPFAGSGTTLLACDNAGIPCVGVELEAEHVAIINARRGASEKKYLFN